MNYVTTTIAYYNNTVAMTRKLILKAMQISLALIDNKFYFIHFHMILFVVYSYVQMAFWRWFHMIFFMNHFKKSN